MIVNYDMYVDRYDGEPISLADHNMRLKFFFLSPFGLPEPLRPEIGKFILTSTSSGFVDAVYKTRLSSCGRVEPKPG